MTGGGEMWLSLCACVRVCACVCVVNVLAFKVQVLLIFVVGPTCTAFSNMHENMKFEIWQHLARCLC